MDVDAIYAELKTKSRGAIDFVTSELRQIRTGKASPSLVEGIKVSAYGGSTTLTLRELASISTDSNTSIVIDPFDPSTVQEIERAIRTSPLNLSPAVDGKIIRINIPPLDEEQRHKFTRIASEKVEEGKIQIRQHRDTARKGVKTLLEIKSIGEDDKFRSEKEIDVITKQYTDELDALKDKKTAEIMSL